MNGILKLTLADLNNKTIVKSIYQKAPFKVYSPIYKKNKAELTIMNVTPGVLSGDNHYVEINCENKSDVLIKEQGSMKIFDTNGGECSQKMLINVAENAFFKYLPYSIIPYKNSNFCGENSVYIKKSSKLAFAEIISSGRIAMQEEFLMKKFSSKTKVFLEDKLIYVSNEYINPEEFDYKNIGFWEEYSHIGTCFIYMQEEDYSRIIENIKERGNIAFSKCKTGFLIRMIANTQQEIYECFEEIIGIV